jgi:hypothetical protein
MRTIPFAAFVAAVVACSPRFPSAQEVPARHGGYAVEAVDEWGRTLPTFDHRGRTYVLGTLGQRYLLRFRNGSGRRVEVVASVDGRDVIDGRPASLSRRGYVVAPGGEVTIDGFRVSQEAVAAFRFSSVPRSYAARKGDARDVGVVGVAVFPERPPRYAVPHRYPPYPPYPYPYPNQAEAPPPTPPHASRGEGPSDGQAPSPRGEGPSDGQASSPRGEGSSDGRAPGPRGEGASDGQAAPAPGEGLASSAPHRSKSAERPGLGTEFGEEHASRVESTTFERASARPEAVLTFRYDDRTGLLALGVDVDGRWDRRDEAWRREQASPFRADAGYCEPPPGWRPGIR